VSSLIAKIFCFVTARLVQSRGALGLVRRPPSPNPRALLQRSENGYAQANDRDAEQGTGYDKSDPPSERINLAVVRLWHPLRPECVPHRAFLGILL
jgi:hypothetical protein